MEGPGSLLDLWTSPRWRLVPLYLPSSRFELPQTLVSPLGDLIFGAIFGHVIAEMSIVDRNIFLLKDNWR